MRFSETWRSLKPDICNVRGRPGQQPSSQCQFAEESDCLATDINPDTLVPQPIGTYKRMGGRKVVGLTCESYIIRRRVFVLGTSTSALNVCECFGVRRLSRSKPGRPRSLVGPTIIYRHQTKRNINIRISVHTKSYLC